MPLERHELESIQCDCAADDIEIPDAARAWSEEEAYAFFESGGTAWPNPQGLEATELLAYYEARKPAAENHSASALLAALGKSLGMEDELAAGIRRELEPRLTALARELEGSVPSARKSNVGGWQSPPLSRRDHPALAGLAEHILTAATLFVSEGLGADMRRQRALLDGGGDLSLQPDGHQHADHRCDQHQQHRQRKPEQTGHVG